LSENALENDQKISRNFEEKNLNLKRTKKALSHGKPEKEKKI